MCRRDGQRRVRAAQVALARRQVGATSPSCAARRAASRRVVTPSFVRTAATWCSAVRWETISRSAISTFVSPAATSDSTSSWRAVRPAEFERVASRWRGGTRTPISRSRRAMCFVKGSAPRPRVISNASTSDASLSSMDSMRARSYVHPTAPKASAAARQSRFALGCRLVHNAR